MIILSTFFNLAHPTNGTFFKQAKIDLNGPSKDELINCLIQGETVGCVQTKLAERTNYQIMILKYNINEKRFEGFIPYEAMSFYSCIIIQVWENEINMWNQQQQLEQAKTVKKNEIICNICLQPPESTYVFLECGHLPFCEQCTNIIMKSKYPKCPTCRQHVTRRVRAFLQQP